MYDSCRALWVMVTVICIHADTSEGKPCYWFKLFCVKSCNSLLNGHLSRLQMESKLNVLEIEYSLSSPVL